MHSTLPGIGIIRVTSSYCSMVCYIPVTIWHYNTLRWQTVPTGLWQDLFFTWLHCYTSVPGWVTCQLPTSVEYSMPKKEVKSVYPWKWHNRSFVRQDLDVPIMHCLRFTAELKSQLNINILLLIHVQQTVLRNILSAIQLWGYKCTPCDRKTSSYLTRALSWSLITWYSWC